MVRNMLSDFTRETTENVALFPVNCSILLNTLTLIYLAIANERLGISKSMPNSALIL